LEDVHDDLHKIKLKGWGGKMKNKGRLFRRPKLNLSCSAEGKEGRTVIHNTYMNLIGKDNTYISSALPRIGPIQKAAYVEGVARRICSRKGHDVGDYLHALHSDSSEVEGENVEG
jgi:hypothetical protein